jgi:hypothetical protein
LRLQRDVFIRRDFYAHDGVSFSSMEELREVQVEDGSHSIIDMIRVTEQTAPRPASFAVLEQELLAALMGGATSLGTVFRMSDDELQKCFSTAAPSRSTIERNDSAACELCERGHGRYALVFDDGTPAEIYFVGISGD